MTKYYVDVDEELANRLQQTDEDEIIQALKNVAAQQSADELAQYNSVKEIRNDSEKSEAERKRLELKWQRRIGGPVRR